MADETRPKGWTPEIALHHMERIVADLRTYVDERFRCQQDAVEKTALALEKRLESMNEFRSQLTDQVATFLSKSEYEAHHEVLGEKVNATNSRLDKLESRSGGLQAGWGYLIGIMGLLGSIVALFAYFSKK